MQMPMNGREPLFKTLDDVVKDPKWNFDSLNIEANGTLEPDEYFDILSGCSEKFDIWRRCIITTCLIFRP